jgi:arylsulfatase
MMDVSIGQVLEAPEEKGYLDNAVVMFTSDHEDYRGDYRYSQKWTNNDIITRMPLVPWAHRRIPDGQIQDAPCPQMDLGPAILELAVSRCRI